jgi:hypothetical protein
MRKAIYTLATALLLTSISFPTISFADDQGDDSGSTDDVNITHIEIEGTYEDYIGVVIPPVAIKGKSVKDPNIYVLPVKPVEDYETEARNTSVVGSHSPFTPYANKKPELLRNSSSRHEPVPVNSINLSQVTPADEFVSSACMFGGTLAIVAALLFGLIGANSFINRRKLKSTSSNSSKP